MARGRKPALSLEEQLENLVVEIERTEASLKDMKQTKKELEEQIKQARLIELDALITERGLTFDQVAAMLKGEKDKE